ncbi:MULTISPECIES: type II toxin-antitoxin system ParD family antitoxin [unclassified Chamaesiphon]|uniref:ribbon-helix-helix domain-containing protein n=1 Tax=unclassified Chamaesiphon TaxID=2620921 RepID=UPI00286A74AD|nr:MULTISPECIES: type II toxin-antitoxin system ParD family antitoxin [unclassified Chamaesiphon]
MGILSDENNCAVSQVSANSVWEIAVSIDLWVTYNRNRQPNLPEQIRAGVIQVTLPPELELIVSRQLTSGKYQNAIEVIRTAIELLDKQEDIYQGKLGELQQAASIGWEASQRGEVVDGNIAMEQIRSNLKSRYSK